MKSLQIVPYPLTNQNAVVGGRATYSFDQIPVTQFGRIAHMIGLLFDLRLTPTFTTAPTLAGFWSFLNSMVFYDSASERCNLSAFQLRAQLIEECGRDPMPNPDLNTGSTNMFTARLFLPLGPLNSAGWSTDWLYPVAALKSGEMRLGFGALTDFSADTTVLTATLNVSALLAVLDNEIRVPPAFERRAFNFSANDNVVQGRALYNNAIVMKQSNGAFAAGDLSNVTIDTGDGSIPSTPATQYTAMSQLGKMGGAGIITQLRGEPVVSTDDNEKIVNLASPTAIQAADPLIQALIPSFLDGRITKQQFEAMAGMRFRWTGALATPSIIVGRTLAQPQAASTLIAAKAAQVLGKGAPSTGKVKTISGRPWRQPSRTEYMPYSFRW